MKTGFSADRPHKVKRLSKQFDLLQYEWDIGGSRNCCMMEAKTQLTKKFESIEKKKNR